MDRTLFWWAAALAMGPASGWMVADASRKLPLEADLTPRPLPLRFPFAVAACTIAALWSIALAPNAEGLVGAVLGWLIVLLSMLDAEHFWLPHRITVPLGALGLAQAAAFTPGAIPDRLIGAALGFASLWGLAWAYRKYRGREGLGGGDFRLLAAAGAWVGWAGLPSVLVIASVSGLLAVGLMAVGGRRPALTQQAPFGVFLGIGLWLTWLYGPIGRPDL